MANEWSRAKRLLCVRLDSLGDVLMTTPAIRAVKRSGPGRRVTLLTSPVGVEAAGLVPEVDEVLPYGAPWMKATAPRLDGQADRAMIELLRAHRFDAAIIFTVYSQNPLPLRLAHYLADIPLPPAPLPRKPVPTPHPLGAGENPKAASGMKCGASSTSSPASGSGRRTSASPCASPSERVARPSASWALGLEPGGRWVIIHPGATAPSRRYPRRASPRSRARLALEDGLQIVFTGSACERELVEGIRAAMGVPSHSLVARLDLAGLAALLSVAPLLVANNTGPVHVAAAVGTPWWICTR